MTARAALQGASMSLSQRDEVTPAYAFKRPSIGPISRPSTATARAAAKSTTAAFLSARWEFNPWDVGGEPRLATSSHVRRRPPTAPPRATARDAPLVYALGGLGAWHGN
jgi:hypothetical protein